MNKKSAMNALVAGTILLAGLNSGTRAQTLNWNLDLVAQATRTLKANAPAHPPKDKVSPEAILGVPENSDKFPFQLDDTDQDTAMEEVYDWGYGGTIKIFPRILTPGKLLEGIFRVCDPRTKNSCQTLAFSFPQITVDTNKKVLLYGGKVVGTLNSMSADRLSPQNEDYEVNFGKNSQGRPYVLDVIFYYNHDSHPGASDPRVAMYLGTDN